MAEPHPKADHVEQAPAAAMVGASLPPDVAALMNAARSEAPAFAVENSVATIMAYGTSHDTRGTARIEIMAMLRQIEVPADQIHASCERGVEVARNQAANALLESPYDWLLMVDRDMIPEPKTRPFLEARGHIVGAAYPLGDPSAWADPETLHCGLIRIHRSVFEQLSPPWFKFVMNERGTQRTECECHYLTRHARDAGFSVLRAGYCGHAPFDEHRI